MLSQGRKTAILQKLAERTMVYDPTPGYTQAMNAPPGTKTGYAKDNSVAPPVNTAALGGRRGPAAVAAMRTPPAQSAPPPEPPAFKDNKMFATGGFGSNARIPGVRQ
jgi:hypothetical protein